MGGQINQYTEKRMVFGCAPSSAPLPGEFWAMEEVGRVVAVDFLCPCGCGSECYTPVTEADQPRKERHWVYKPGPTLEPSVRYTGGCKAHFNVTDGKSVFHGDSGK